MHFTLSAIAGMLAQEWYVICAYFGMYVLLEVRKHAYSYLNATEGFTFIAFRAGK